MDSCYRHILFRTIDLPSQDEGGVWRGHVDQMRRAAETLTEKTVNDALQPSFSEPTEIPSVPLTNPAE